MLVHVNIVKILAPEKECLQCFTCQTQVHELCDNLDNDRKLWTNTCFDKEQFFCDKCLTNIEIILAGSESQKINTLEKKVDNMENKLDEITTLLKSSKTVSDSSHKMSATQSIWYDKNTLASIKSPSEKAVLVVKSTQNATTNENNKTKVEKPLWRIIYQYHNRIKVGLTTLLSFVSLKILVMSQTILLHLIMKK